MKALQKLFQLKHTYLRVHLLLNLEIYLVTMNSRILLSRDTNQILIDGEPKQKNQTFVVISLRRRTIDWLKNSCTGKIELSLLTRKRPLTLKSKINCLEAELISSKEALELSRIYSMLRLTHSAINFMKK